MTRIQNLMKEHQRHHFENKAVGEERREPRLGLFSSSNKLAGPTLLTQPVPGGLMFPEVGTLPSVCSPARGEDTGHTASGKWCLYVHKQLEA